MFRSVSEGFFSSGFFTKLTMLRTTCTGVTRIPQGNPHQPNRKENIASTIWLFIPQDLQQILGLLLQDVNKNKE
jgi:hypothetical protein